MNPKAILMLSLTSALTLTLSACSRDESPSQTAGAAAAPAAPAHTKDLSCRTLMAQYNLKTAAFIAPAQNLNVLREYKRVIRKGCDGKVTSDKVETVTPPHVNFRLNLPKPREFKSVFVFNETSCDHKLMAMPTEPNPATALLSLLVFPLGALQSVTGDGKSYVDVRGDLATALLTFEMAQGLNAVYAEYHFDCMPQTIEGNRRVIVGGEQKCAASNEKQIGLYPINIEYEERTLPGEDVIAPSKETCDREAKEKKP